MRFCVTAAPAACSSGCSTPPATPTGRGGDSAVATSGTTCRAFPSGTRGFGGGDQWNNMPGFSFRYHNLERRRRLVSKQIASFGRALFVDFEQNKFFAEYSSRTSRIT